MLKPWEYLKKNIVVVCKDGYTVEGKCDCYFSAEDNEPDPEAIIVGTEEIPIKDIMRIQII